MTEDIGRVPDGTGLSQVEPSSSGSLAPPGFDPSRKPRFAFHQCALSPDCVTVNREPGNTFLSFNFDLCRALDMTKMGIVLEKMTMAGWLDRREAEILHGQAGGLLAMLRTANNRAYAIAMEARQGGDARGSVEDDSAGPKDIAR